MGVGVEASRTARGSADLMVQSTLNSVLGLVFFMVLVRFISKEEMGVYATLHSTFQIFQVIGVFGLMFAGSYFVSKVEAEGGLWGTPQVAESILLVGLGTSLVASSTYIVFSQAFTSYLAKSPQHLSLFQFTSVGVFLVAFSLILDGLMQGLRRFRSLALIRVMGYVIRVTITVLLLILGFGLIGVLIGWVLLGVTKIAASAFNLRRELSLHPNIYPLKPVIVFTAPLFGFQLITYVSNHIDIISTMVFFSPSMVGVYNVSITAFGVLQMILIMPMIITLLPAMTKAYTKYGEAGVEDVVFKASKYVALFFLPTAIGLSSLSGLVVRLMAGRIYAEASLPLAVISAASVAYGLAIPLIVALQALGKPANLLKVTLLAFLIEGTACFIFTPLLGIIGAAFGRCFLFAGILFLGYLEVKRFVKVRLDWPTILRAFLAAGVMGLLVFYLAYFYPSIIMMPIYVITGIIVYGVTLRSLGALKKHDLQVLEGILPRSFRFLARALWKVLLF
jgi:O-antigen/teichoic acid export membrane protein